MRLPLPGTLLSSGLRYEVASLKQQITTTSKEATTGQYADLTAHLSGRIGNAMLSQKALDDIQNERTRLSLREGRLDLTQSSLAIVADSTGTLPARMQTALASGDAVTQQAIARDARTSLEQSFAALNSRHGERFLFAGDATDSPPFGSVDTFLDDVRTIAESCTSAADFETALDAYFNTPGSGWQANVYTGSATSSDPEAVTGMDPSLLKIFAGLAVAALSAPGDSPSVFRASDDVMLSASQKMFAGQTDLTNVRADVGVSQSQVQKAKESLDTEETVFTASLNQLTARDQYEAAASLQELETNLEASYMLTARLANLNIMNFMG